jgi:hypothetical protein
VGWLWILLGFATGLALGLKFQQDEWLGGYSSLKRRLYRLGHISFFGLGAVNLMFHLTASGLPQGALTEAAAWLFIAGAVMMPACCGVMARQPKARPLFALPVLSLLAANAFTLFMVIKQCWRDS